MAYPYPDELNVPKFEKWVCDFSDKNLSKVFEYLRATAQNVGTDVFERRHKPNNGGGTEYYSAGLKPGFASSIRSQDRATFRR